MFNGSVSFASGIKGNGLTFPKFAYNPNVAGVAKVEIEGPGGHEIRCTVHLTNVTTEDVGRDLARQVYDAALNRISYHHGTSVLFGRLTSDCFVPVGEPKGVVGVSVHMHLTATAEVTLGLSEASLKPELEQLAPRGEANFGMFRSALNSTGPVEAYLSLYQVLMILFSDEQKDIDAFIVSQEPGVPQTQHPKKKPGVMETIYSRLRNELAHKRNVNVDDTKKEMENRLGGLTAMVRKAIELHS
jgi:hypothetical protein